MNSVITGSSPVCTGGRTFTLDNAPTGSTVTWTATPVHLFSTTSPYNTSGTGTTAKLAAASSSAGSGTITFTITPSCGSTVSVQKTIRVGKPNIARTKLTNGNLISYSSSVTNSVCNLVEYTTDVAGDGQTSTTWSRIAANPTNASWSNAASNNISFYFYAVGQTATFRVKFLNTCGNTTYDFKFKAIDCSSDACSQYSVSPNPASTDVVINIPAPCSTAQAEESSTLQAEETSIEAVSLYNSDGLLLRTEIPPANARQVTVDVSNLTNGLYFLKIKNRKHTETHRILIKD